MTDTIEFFFDFSSPYAYVASHKIDRLAADHGRVALWRPMMLGVAFKVTGNRPLLEQPMKGEYSRRDLERVCRHMEVPWVLPDPFPVVALAPSRAFYWLDGRDPELARRYAKAVFNAYFGEGRNISLPETAAGLAEPLGVDAGELLAAIQDPAIKERLKEETGAAVERGVFGSPFIFVDDEPFWGSDRLWMVKKWMESGGW